MAITREKKETIVAEYTEQLHRSQAVIVTEYRGLTVKQLEALRRDLRGCESELTVTKNTLLARALTEVGMAAPESLLTGPTAVTFCYDEMAAPAKMLDQVRQGHQDHGAPRRHDGPVRLRRGGRTGPDGAAEQGSVAGPGGRHAAVADQRAGQRVGRPVARVHERAQRTIGQLEQHVRLTSRLASRLWEQTVSN